jgi:hypothetical protein
VTIWICRWRMNTLVTSQYQPRLSSITKIFSRRISQSDWNIQIKLNYTEMLLRSIPSHQFQCQAVATKQDILVNKIYWSHIYIKNKINRHTCVLHAVLIVFYLTSKGLHKIYNKILFPIKQSWFSFVTSVFCLPACSMVLIFGLYLLYKCIYIYIYIHNVCIMNF